METFPQSILAHWVSEHPSGVRRERFPDTARVSAIGSCSAEGARYAVHMSVFVGRNAELDELGTAFSGDARLVTLTGPAGIGKSRLAREFLPRHHLTFFCDLSHALDADAVAAVVAETLELPSGEAFGKAGNVELALHALGPALLVLDNFEQVLEAAPMIARWSQGAPELRILVTSRERLRVDHERVIELGPLGLPEAHAPADSESVQMLLGCARRLRHGFALRRNDVDTVARVVEQLDGIPLALELAAPRLVFLGADTLLQRLEARFKLLRGQQGTLHGAIEWSWNLLDDLERSVLSQCSVFRGGFDLEAAEAVVAIDDASVMDVLQSLFEKSLLRAEGDGRFGLFLSIRDFAAEQLDDVHAAKRHASYYATLGEAAQSALHGPETVSAWEELRRERENLKAAARANVDASIRAAIALGPAMLAQGPYEEYEAMLGEALKAPLAPSEEIRARVNRGDARRLAGKLDDAIADLDRALELARASDLPALEARTERARGTVALVAGELKEAIEHYERALPLLSGDADPVEEAQTLSALGAARAALGQVDEAQAAEERARALLQRAGALREEGLVTAYLGNLFIDQGRFDDAMICFAQAEAIHDQVADRFGSAFTTANRGILHHVRLHLDEAVAAYDAAIAAFRRVGARRYEGAFRGYRALARSEAGAPVDEVRHELELAVQMLVEAKDPRFEALFLAYLGAAEVRTGAIERGRDALERAEEQIATLHDPFLLLAVQLQRGHLERAEAETDASRASSLRDQCDARLDQARAGDSESPIRRNADVLFSARTLSGVKPRQTTTEPASGDALSVGSDASWFSPPGGERIELEGRDALINVLHALVTAHREQPDEPIPRDALVAAGWPGERMLPRAAANRLRVAISTLRKLGLHDAILTRRGAYLIHPAIAVHEVA